LGDTRRQDDTATDSATLTVTEQERKIIEILRSLDFGEMRIVVKDGTAVHVEEIKKSIKL